MTASASVSEVVWTVLVLIGLGANSVGLWRAVVDERDRRREGLNGARAYVLHGHVLHAVAQVTTQLLFLVAGAIALVTEPTAVSRFYLSLALIAAVVVVALVGLYDMHARVVLRRLIDEEAHGKWRANGGIE